MKAYTSRELEKYDGSNGRLVYIAYKERVYDVSESFLWRNGVHQVLHRIGGDLTEALRNAPHGEEFITKFPVVGYLVKEK